MATMIMTPRPQDEALAPDAKAAAVLDTMFGYYEPEPATLPAEEPADYDLVA